MAELGEDLVHSPASIPYNPAMPDGTPPAATQKDLEIKFTLAREILGSLQRAIRSRQLYEPEHALHNQATEDVIARFLAFFDRFSYLRLEVKPDRLLFEGKTVYQADARDPEIPFRLYRDGIREIRFHRGLSREEVLDFMGLLEIDPRDVIEMGEDFVSLLWSKDFRSIDYAAVDEFEVGTAESWTGLDEEEQQKVKEVAKNIDRITVSLQAVEAPKGADPGDPDDDLFVPERPEVAAATAPGVEIAAPDLEAAFSTSIAEAADQLRKEIELETLGGAIRRSLEILVKLFRGKERHNAQEVGPLLRGVVNFYARRLEFGSLGHLIVKLQESGLLATMPGGNDLLKAILDDARKAASPVSFLNYLNKGGAADVEGLNKYMTSCGAALTPTVAALYGRVGLSPIRRILRQYLVAWKSSLTSELGRKLIQTSDRFPEEAFEIVIAGRVPAVHDELTPYLKNANPTLRIQAIQAAAASDGPGRSKLLSRALDDSDSRVRGAALTSMSETKDPALRPLLEAWVNDRVFVERLYWEKEASMKALAACGGVSALRAIADKSLPLFNRAKFEEVRKAALAALGIKP